MNQNELEKKNYLRDGMKKTAPVALWGCELLNGASYLILHQFIT